MNNKRLMIAGFVIYSAIITWTYLKCCHDLPWPPRFIFGALTFGLLDLFSGVNEEFAAVLAVGLVVGTFVAHGPANCPKFNCNPNCNQTTPQKASLALIDTPATGTAT